MTQTLLTDTDQTDCYEPSGGSIDCIGSGQDAAQSPNQAFTSGDRWHTGERGIEDRATGLTWRAQAGDFPLTWEESVAFVGALNSPDDADHMPWRMPTRRELFSLISHQYVNPALPKGHPFENVFSGYYWTGTPCTRLPDQAWYVHLGGGKVYRGMKHGSYLVWAVSGPLYGSTTTGKRFFENDDTVLDSATGRHWYRGPQLTAVTVSWQDALQEIQRLNTKGAAGFRDWRLPNIREFESIVDDTRHSPANPEGLQLAGHPGAGYWSSTTSVYEPRYAWVLYTQDGALGVGFKQQADFRVTAVRGGPPFSPD